MTSKVGMHWLREHPDNQVDLPHIERMQYPSIKLFKNVWDNRDACASILSVLPRDSYILGRDHALSEQKEDSYRDPVGTGTRHANEWAEKLRNGQCHLPTDRTFFLGINEPNADSGDRHAIDKYTEAFLDRLREHGLRGGAFNFSTGHPRTVDGTPNTPADYTVFERSHQAILRGHHIGVLHIYGTAAVPCAPGHYDRLKACDWQDVEWVVGECGADEHVIGGGPHDGYIVSMAGHIHDYPAWIDSLILGVNDGRIHSYQIFTYDFSHPWASFDVSEIRDALESYSWRHMQVAPTPPQPTPPGAIRVGEVTAPAGLKYRSGPGTNYAAIGALAYGSTVLYDREQQGFLHMPEGWLSSAYVGEPPSQPTSTPQPTAPSGVPFRRDCWQRSIEFVRRWEGGWANNPNDPGGATNKGITIGTYTRWRAAHNQPQPTVEELRNLSDEEANQIYFEWYWKASGADLMPWPLCLAVFDTAVNAGVGKAQEIFDKSNGSFIAYMGWLIDWYARVDGFEHFGRAWMRRRAELLLEATK